MLRSGRAQVVRHRIGKSLQLLVGGLDLDGMALLRFVQFTDFIFGLLAVGDVADGAGDQPPVIGLDRAQANLDREFAAVFAQAIELQAHAHRTHLGVGEVLAALLRMLAAKARRHQHLDRVAEQLGAGVTEELFGLRVDQHHAAVVADQDHRVGRGFEQRAKAVVKLGDFGLGPFAVGDVADGAGDQPPVIGLDRA